VTNMNDEHVITWLLEGDPAIRWQVYADLLDAEAGVVAAERARVASEGWGAALLAKQTPDGQLGQRVVFTQVDIHHLHLAAIARSGVDAWQ
jgi:hypothetical protein